MSQQITGPGAHRVADWNVTAGYSVRITEIHGRRDLYVDITRDLDGAPVAAGEYAGLDGVNATIATDLRILAARHRAATAEHLAVAA